jgi:hypothetical protein
LQNDPSGPQTTTTDNGPRTTDHGQSPLVVTLPPNPPS